MDLAIGQPFFSLKQTLQNIDCYVFSFSKCRNVSVFRVMLSNKTQQRIKFESEHDRMGVEVTKHDGSFCLVPHTACIILSIARLLILVALIAFLHLFDQWDMRRQPQANLFPSPRVEPCQGHDTGTCRDGCKCCSPFTCKMYHSTEA